MTALAGCPLCDAMVWVEGVNAWEDYGTGVIEEHETADELVCAASTLTYNEAWEQR